MRNTELLYNNSGLNRTLNRIELLPSHKDKKSSFVSPSFRRYLLLGIFFRALYSSLLLSSLLRSKNSLSEILEICSVSKTFVRSDNGFLCCFLSRAQLFGGLITSRLLTISYEVPLWTSHLGFFSFLVLLASTSKSYSSSNFDIKFVLFTF